APGCEGSASPDYIKWPSMVPSEALVFSFFEVLRMVLWQSYDITRTIIGLYWTWLFQNGVPFMSRPRREIALSKAFGAPCVLTLQQLCQTFRCSRATILRRLAEHGYYTSYNHSGKFLTIPEVAQFDSQGLWTWKTARFSIFNKPKDT